MTQPAGLDGSRYRDRMAETENPESSDISKIVDTGNDRVRSARITINAPAADIFDLIAHPANHPLFDGSGTVTSSSFGPDRLTLGATFGMSMRIVVPYRMTNTVMEFDEGRLIAWRHIGGHRWRYELERVTDSSTLVTETFDGTTSRFPPSLRLMNAYENNTRSILKTLEELKRLAESAASNK
ncbi:unannotated protein [freshwater metagenome]|uniref:Unannotated protein n=1 Tax=freshwater metagenome TaxID=449393 RepID=A0A6J7PX79_9ZZZZ